MPFGSIGIAKRLGIANCVKANAVSFGQTVLGLSTGFPVYQAQLVHSTVNSSGPSKAAAEWCESPDLDVQNVHVIRELSTHDSQWSRRNLKDPGLSGRVYDWLYHKAEYSNQIYYVNNEPSMGSKLTANTACLYNCWNPRDRLIDDYLVGCFPNPSTQFWEPHASGWVQCEPTPCPQFCNPVPMGTKERIRALALAYVYLRLKNDTEAQSHGHVVLPPSTVGPGIGKYDTFWSTFFDQIHGHPAANNNGFVSVGNCSIEVIDPVDLLVVHIHHYTNPPVSGVTPNSATAAAASWIREGLEWYAERYYDDSEAELEFDLLLSEFGIHWNTPQALKWAGGYSSFRLGLAWWNTYLSWITRLAPTECNLKNWDLGEHTVHACIHDPANPPYIVHDTQIPSDDGIVWHRRNQYYLNTNTMTVGTMYSAAAVEVTNLVVDVGVQTYQKSFLRSGNSVNWPNPNSSWHLAPFGACFKVWSEIGNDTLATSTDLNHGWVYAEGQGVVASAEVIIPEGYSTVFFPVIKGLGDYSLITDPKINFTWTSTGYPPKTHGFMAFHDFEDYHYFTDPAFPVPQKIYPAMIFPVVCWSQPARLVTVELTKNWATTPGTGKGVYLGRPIVIPRILSWFIEQ